MSRILIGSSAIKHWFPDFPREPKDIDYAVLHPKSREGDIEYLENPVLFEFCDELIASPGILYTLKISHLFWHPEQFEKHMFDVQFLRQKGCTINKPLFHKLYSYWTGKFGVNKRSNLQMSAEDFFDNAVKCEHDHDYLHTVLIKHPHFKGQALPTYTKILVGEVEVGEHLFNTLSHEEKCNLVIEEVMCMAFERMFHSNYKVNYYRMLKKFLMNHAPLWEATFIIENWIELHTINFDFITFINSKLHVN